MIIGIGVDIIEVHRFNDWHKYSKDRLLKVFSDQEISYCLSVPAKSAERFAGRFAAKEACYKAISPDISFSKFCTLVEIVLAPSGAPSLQIKRDILGLDEDIEAHLSFSHTSFSSVAVVIIEKS